MRPPSLSTLFLSFLRLGLTAFGGPAMVAFIKDMTVTRRNWLDEKSFKDGVALCQIIPGATAMQTAAYVGLRAKGIRGALVSFIGFGLPAFILMLILSALYDRYHAVPGIISLFNGLQVAVVAIVANATYSFGRSTFKNYKDVLIAIASGMLFWTGISPFIVIMVTACAGALIFRNVKTELLSNKTGSIDRTFFIKLLIVMLILLSLLIALYFVDLKLLRLALLMMKIDLFAFGGGFGSVPLMLHEIVNIRGWMDSKTFMDGIALGQVTPGPIVITSTFVGYMLYGLPGAIVASAAIFTPSLFLVILVTPFFDNLRASAYFTAATRGVLASFVGLLFFVAVKFGVAVPWDIVRVALAVASFAGLMKKVDILYVVLIVAVISVFVF